MEGETMVEHEAKRAGKHIICCEKKVDTLDIHTSLSGPVWKQAQQVSLTGSLATTAYVLRGADGLYIGFHCLLGRESKPAGEKRERDGWMFAYGDDIVDVFIDERHNHLEYYQLALNAYATKYDARRTEAGGIEDKNWDGIWDADVRIYEGCWEAKLFIPYVDLGIEPKEGDVLGLNLCREQRGSYSVWVPVKRHFHEPENFGTLFLGAREALPVTIDYDETVGSIQSFESASPKLRVDETMAKGAFKIGDGKYWSFLNGPWNDGPNGEIISPRGDSLPHGAFWLGQAFSDFTAEFQVSSGFPGACGARFFFRAQDATRYYAFDIPFCGQQVRTRAAWCLIAKGDGKGFDQYLQLSLLQRVVPEYERWYDVRVEVVGEEFRVWVDGQPLPPVRDDSYRSGFIGIGTFGGRDSFRNLRISGKESESLQWQKEVSVPELFFNPWESFLLDMQNEVGAQICKTDKGEIVGVLWSSGKVYLSHSINGRDWTAPELSPLSLKGIMGMLAGDKRLIIFDYEQDVAVIRYEVTDDGHMCQGPVRVPIHVPETVSSFYHRSRINRLPDGSLLLFMFGTVKEHLGGGDGHSGIGTWGKVAWEAFCLRSSDGGRSWGKPISLDKTLGSRGKYVEPKEGGGNYDMTEVAGGWVEGERCVAFIRPVYLPWIWETWSEDSGKTWGPAQIGPFPGWVPDFLRLNDGTLLLVHRYPYLTAHVSCDGGRTWSPGTRIGWVGTGTYGMTEVEPGLVFILSAGYSSSGGPTLLRGQFVRVKPEGVFPIGRTDVSQ